MRGGLSGEEDSAVVRTAGGGNARRGQARGSDIAGPGGDGRPRAGGQACHQVCRAGDARKRRRRDHAPGAAGLRDGLRWFLRAREFSDEVSQPTTMFDVTMEVESRFPSTPGPLVPATAAASRESTSTPSQSNSTAVTANTDMAASLLAGNTPGPVVVVLRDEHRPVRKKLHCVTGSTQGIGLARWRGGRAGRGRGCRERASGRASTKR